MWLKLHDNQGEVDIDDLTEDGAHDARFQCQQMLEELDRLDFADEQECSSCGLIEGCHTTGCPNDVED